MFQAVAKVLILFLIPITFLYGIVEIINAWKLIKFGIFTHHPTYQISIWLIKHFRGIQESEKYQEQLKQNKDYLSTRGHFIFVSGILYLAVSITFINLIRSMP